MKLRENTAGVTMLAPVMSRKLGFFLGLGLLVTVPYFAIEHHPLFTPAMMTLTWVDRVTPFFAPAIWCYVSLYLLLPLPLVLVRDSVNLRQMVFGFAWITLVSHVVFALWPTAIPTLVSTSQVTDPILRMILAADTNGNAIPSLHASLAIYCALCCTRLEKNWRFRTTLWVWVLLILASTLLAKRHAFLDICAGAALGGSAFVALLRKQWKESAECPALQATLHAREDMSRGFEAQVAGLGVQDWRKRAVELAVFIALAVCGVWLTVTSWESSRRFLLAAAIPITALALNAFVLLMHDGMHFSLFPDRRWNRMGSVLLGGTFLMSYSAYRVLHTRHHMYLGDSRDPDDYQNYLRRPRGLLWSLHFMRLSVGPVLYLALIPVLALKHATDRERRHILAEYLILLAAYSVLWRLVPRPLLLVTWLAPLLIVGILTAVRGFTQHGITDPCDPYIASRTVLPNPVVGFFLLHENYHLEHHLFPEVPSYHLPHLHELVWRRLPRVVSSRSYLGFLARFLRATPRLDESPIGLESPAEKST